MDKPLSNRERVLRQARIFSVDDRLYSRPASGGGQPVLPDVPLQQDGTGEPGNPGVPLANLTGGDEGDPGKIVEIGGQKYLRQENITRAGIPPGGRAWLIQ
jgi:hypothetical protein